MMILLGAHYLPFVFLYGMRMFAVLAAVLVGGGTLIAMYFSASFSAGAWYQSRGSGRAITVSISAASVTLREIGP